ncbi:MAG: DUF2142 domain-containing protein [Actinobacteria bacterium]|nr:DUF2142 domain-containing protein [Actinomycetota bacterium]
MAVTPEDRREGTPADDDGGARHERTGTVNWPRLFLVIGAIFGLCHAILLPPSRPLDEPAHLGRVATIDRGAVIPPSFRHTDAAYRLDGCDVALIDRATTNFQALIDHRPQRLDRADRWRYHVTNPPCRRDVVLYGGGSISNAEINSPVPYLPAMVGYAIGKPIGGALGGLYGARLAQLVAYLSIVWWALRRLPWGRPFAAAVALVPTAIGGAAGVSADPISFALTLAAVSLTLGLISRSEGPAATRASTGSLARLTAVFVLLALCKPAATPLVLLAVVVPTAAFGTVRRRAIWSAITIGLVALGGGAWALGVSSKVHITNTPPVDSAVTAQWLNQHLTILPGALWRTLMISDAVRYLLGGVITPLGLDVLTVPVWITLIGLAVLVVARICDPLPTRFGRGPSRRPKRASPALRRQLRLERGVAAAIVCAGIVVVVYGIYLASNPPGATVISGIQGRYFLPYLLLGLVGVRPTRAGSASRRVQLGVVGALILLNTFWLIRLLVWWRLI